MTGLNEKVRNYWETEVCGADPASTAVQKHLSLACFQAVERNRYYHHMESVGTKTYEPRELARLFSGFSRAEIAPHLTPCDLKLLPRWIANWLPAFAGFFLSIRAEK